MALIRHMQSVHEGKKPFKCEIFQKGDLKVILNNFTMGRIKKPYKCNTCDTSFNKKQSLNVHIEM